MSKTAAIIAAILYVACVVAANWATATFEPWHVAGLIITAGTWFIGATFILRDVVQLGSSKRRAYYLIALALLINFAMSLRNDDLLWITIGSCVAFAASETLDTEVFSMDGPYTIVSRVRNAALYAGLVDSILFSVIALSPLTTGIVAWGDLWRVVLAQLIAKCIVGVLGSIPFSRLPADIDPTPERG